MTAEEALKVFSTAYDARFQDMVKDVHVSKVETVLKGKDWSVEVYRMRYALGGRKGGVPVLAVRLGGEEYVVASVIRVRDAKNMTAIWGFDGLERKEIGGKERALLWKPAGGCGHEMVVFSDPECPFCRRLVPGYLNEAKRRGFCVYHYFYPLSFHKHARKLSRYLAVLLKHSDDKVRALEEFYKVSSDVEKAEELALRNSGLTREQFFEEADRADDLVAEEMKIAEGLGVRGTPTVFLDGRKVSNPAVKDLVTWLGRR